MRIAPKPCLDVAQMALTQKLTSLGQIVRGIDRSLLLNLFLDPDLDHPNQLVAARAQDTAAAQITIHPR
jgi:hypothetical protein